MRLFKKKILILIFLVIMLIFLVQYFHVNEISTFQDVKNPIDKGIFYKMKNNGAGIKLNMPDNDDLEMVDQQLKMQHSVFSWNSRNLDNARSLFDLEKKLVPNNVYYVWCGNRTFEFKHYLSVLSAWRSLSADVIEIHYQLTPLQNNYARWLDDLKTSIPCLSMYQLPEYIAKQCNQLFGIDIIDDRGGIYVAEDTILTTDILQHRRRNFTAIFDDYDKLKVLFAVRKNPELRKLKIQLVRKTGVLTNNRFIDKNRCLTVDDLNMKALTTPSCLVLKNVILPTNIFTIRSDIGDFLRFLYFGQKDPVYSYTDKKESIPKIVHYIWYTRFNMTFTMYLSILSTLYIVKPESIYIHGDMSLYGYYWDKIKSESKITLIYREPPREIYGRKIIFRHHKSDVIRAEILLKYGGIYLDWDAIWLKPVDDLLSSGYDVIVSYDHMPRPYFPDTINMGVVMAKPRAKYLSIWRDTYRNYNNGDFFHAPIEMPYKVYEKYPWLVHIEKRLQIMCFMLKCHPLFHPDYKNYETAQPFDWKTDAYAIHFTYPDPLELTSEVLLRNASGMFSDIGRHVLKKAGLL